jgi:mono/diheme cytochrome c family protein
MSPILSRLLALFALSLPTLPLAAQDYLADYEPVDNALLVEVPAPARDGDDPLVKRGRYLVGLLGCASCHTDGALLGSPDPALALAGSRVGIAISDPMRVRYPAIIYPPNITPHDATGIGNWTEDELVRMLRAGIGRHGGRALPVMPWQNYARLWEEDARAIARYLMRLEPVEHSIPQRVAEGRPAPAPYVHVGLYQRRD